MERKQRPCRCFPIIYCLTLCPSSCNALVFVVPPPMLLSSITLSNRNVTYRTTLDFENFVTTARNASHKFPRSPGYETTSVMHSNPSRREFTRLWPLDSTPRRELETLESTLLGLRYAPLAT